MTSPDVWHCVIAAGGEAPEEIARATGARTKAGVSFLGVTSLERVLNACREVGFASIRIVADEEAVQGVALTERESVASPGRTNVQSTLNGLAGLPAHAPVFIAPCDVPLMRSEHIKRFLESVDARRMEGDPERNWFAVGLADQADVRSRYPDVPYRYLKFREGRFAAGALYASTPSSVCCAAWQLGVGSERRRSASRIVLQVGLFSLMRYLLGLVPLSEAERRVGKVLGGDCFIFTGCDPETTMDFDTLEELRHVERILRLEQSEG